MTAVWRLELILPSISAVPVFEASLEAVGQAVASNELGPGETAGGPARWRVVAYGLADPDGAELNIRLALAAASAGIEVPPYVLEQLPETDWIAVVRRETRPIRAGRFFVHASHHRGPTPAGAVAIRIDAGRAFGSGEHETTHGCLVAMDRLLRRSPPRTVLDLGAGSGILAIAAAKASDAVVVAADTDPVAVETARGNATANGVADRLRCVVSHGFRNAALRRSGPFDWILANILARPLVAMAPSVVRYLAPGGVAVLSGFLTGQGETVAAAYREAGAGVVDLVEMGEWLTLVVTRAGPE